MPATTATTAPIPTPRRPADDQLTEQRHLIDEASHPQLVVNVFRALAARAAFASDGTPPPTKKDNTDDKEQQ